MTVYGYVRVSAQDQRADRQLVAMRDFGVSEENIFLDKQSGRDFERPAYKQLLKKLKPHDTLVIKSIDRLGRAYGEILNQWRIITKVHEVAIVVLDMPLLDTRAKETSLTGMFVADLVLQILSYIAQYERESIRQRQVEGIKAAQVRGVKFGRCPKERPAIFTQVREDWECGQISARQAGKLLDVTHMTFLKWVNEQ